MSPDLRRSMLIAALVALAGLAAGCTDPGTPDNPRGPPEGFDLRYDEMRVTHLGSTRFVAADGGLATAPIVAVQLPPWLVLGGPSTTDLRARLIFLLTTDDFSRALAEVAPCNVVADGECADGFPVVRWFDTPVPWLFGASLAWAEEVSSANVSTAQPGGGAARQALYKSNGSVDWSGSTPQTIRIEMESGETHSLDIVEAGTGGVREIGDEPETDWARLVTVDAPDGRPPEGIHDYVPFSFADAWTHLTAEAEVPAQPGIAYASYNGAGEVYLTTQGIETTIMRQWSWKIDVDPGAAAATQYSVVKRQQYLGELPVGEPTYNVTSDGTHFDKNEFQLPPERVSLDAGHALAVMLTGGTVPLMIVSDPDPAPVQLRHVYHFGQPPPGGTGAGAFLELDAANARLWRLGVAEATMADRVVDLPALLAAAAERGLW